MHRQCPKTSQQGKPRVLMRGAPVPVPEMPVLRSTSGIFCHSPKQPMQVETVHIMHSLYALSFSLTGYRGPMARAERSIFRSSLALLIREQHEPPSPSHCSSGQAYINSSIESKTCRFLLGLTLDKTWRPFTTIEHLCHSFTLCLSAVAGDHQDLYCKGEALSFAFLLALE